VIEAQLAHVEENRVRAAYNHARYSEERRELMQSWADFADAVRAAYVLKDLLAEIGLTGWAKTSGNRGVHVYSRIRPTHARWSPTSTTTGC